MPAPEPPSSPTPPGSVVVVLPDGEPGLRTDALVTLVGWLADATEAAPTVVWWQGGPAVGPVRGSGRVIDAGSVNDELLPRALAAVGLVSLARRLKSLRLRRLLAPLSNADSVLLGSPLARSFLEWVPAAGARRLVVWCDPDEIAEERHQGLPSGAVIVTAGPTDPSATTVDVGAVGEVGDDGHGPTVLVLHPDRVARALDLAVDPGRAGAPLTIVDRPPPPAERADLVPALTAPVEATVPPAPEAEPEPSPSSPAVPTSPTPPGTPRRSVGGHPRPHLGRAPRSSRGPHRRRLLRPRRAQLARRADAGPARAPHRGAPAHVGAPRGDDRRRARRGGPRRGHRTRPGPRALGARGAASSAAVRPARPPGVRVPVPGPRRGCSRPWPAGLRVRVPVPRGPARLHEHRGHGRAVRPGRSIGAGRRAVPPGGVLVRRRPRVRDGPGAEGRRAAGRTARHRRRRTRLSGARLLTDRRPAAPVPRSRTTGARPPSPWARPVRRLWTRPRVLSWRWERRLARGRVVRPAERLWFAWWSHWHLVGPQWAPAPYDGRIDLFWAETTVGTDATMGWGATGAEVVVHPIPGRHEDLLRPPSLDDIAAGLRARLGTPTTAR